MADGTPRMILVTLQHPSPYYDDSYGVNSENNGPYGDAIIQELIPAVETKFRVCASLGASAHRRSTGGWISLAHQVFYPTSTAACGRCVRTASTSATIRSSTSTPTATRTGSIAVG
jgi:hypothetical protein